jgi:hypothetical protein
LVSRRFSGGFDARRGGLRTLAKRKVRDPLQGYSVIWLTGLIGGVIGGFTDPITSSISPEYFTWGKGILDGEGFQTRVVMFGIKQGISAGVIAGAVCVYVTRRKSKSPPFPFSALLRLIWIPVVGAIVGAVVLPLIAGKSDPANLKAKLPTDLSAAQSASFLRVWWIHTGVYAGLLIGLVLLIVIVVKRRKIEPAEAG